MCISLAIAGASLALSAISTVASIDNANYQQGMLELQAAEQRDQLRMQQENERITAMEAESARLQAYNEQRGANLLYLAGSGTGQNMSFTQGLEAANLKELNRDLANIRLNKLGGISRFANQIRVNKTQVQIGKTNSKSAKFGAVLNFFGDAVSIGDSFANSKLPTGGGGGGGGGQYGTSSAMGGLNA